MTVATKAPPLTEKLFQRQVVELAKILGWRVYHPFLSKWSEKGFPDLTMVRAHDRRLLFAELKAEKGRVSEAQQEWLDLLRAIEHYPTSIDEFLRQKEPIAHPSIQVFVWRPSDWDQIERVLR